MTSISSRSLLIAAASPLALIVATSPALAQDANPAVTGTASAATAAQPADQGANPTPQADQAPAIVVTGFRASLQNAVNKKKKSDQIVESVSAEDIGKLPDASIGEAIARLPGITSQRLSGRADVISIRGFGPDYSTTLLNGREQTSTGDNRAVQFDQYPAEVINQVNIYKTPIASVVGQGLAGTIDLRTIRPLEFGKRVISVGGRAVYPDIGKLNPDAKKYGYRVNGVYVDQFADGRAGVALAASWDDEPYEIKEFNAWGYADGPGGNKVVGGLKSYSRWRGYVRALRAAGIEVDESLRVDAAPVEGDGRAAVERLLARAVEFDAIFAASDVAAVGAMHALQHSDRSVPETAIVGFDDIPAASLASPPLTTVTQDARQAAEALVDALVESIETGSAHDRVLPVRLTVRESSGAR
jgi:hypothetical protein